MLTANIFDPAKSMVKFHGIPTVPIHPLKYWVLPFCIQACVKMRKLQHYTNLKLAAIWG